jgi:hypothetical protein
MERGQFDMNEIEVIARRILGWKLNRWDRWFDPEMRQFIYSFQPDQSLDDAMLIVERLKYFGYSYTPKGDNEVCFNDVCGTGDTLAQAITDAAYQLADNSTVPDEWL